MAPLFCMMDHYEKQTEILRTTQRQVRLQHIFIF